MYFEGVGLSTDFVGGLCWSQTQNFGSEVEIGVVETTDVGGINLVVVVGWEV
jgi:hypothetical protein